MLHGWQSVLLPYLEEGNLYKQIDWAEPWDSPRNVNVFKRAVPLFLNPSVDDDTAEVAGFAVSHYAGNAYVLGGSEPRKIDGMKNGAGKTILSGEAAGNFSPWGRPGNWRDPNIGVNKSPDGFGGNRVGPTAFVMADGSVREVTDDVDPAVLRAMANPDSDKAVLDADR